MKGYINPYVLKLMEEAIKDEASDYSLYSFLAEQCPDNRDAFNRIAADEMKHFKMLTELYTDLSGKSPCKNNTEKDKKYMGNCSEIIKAQLPREQEGAQLYRTLYFAMPMGYNAERNMLFEIMTDEMMHAALLAAM